MTLLARMRENALTKKDCDTLIDMVARIKDLSATFFDDIPDQEWQTMSRGKEIFRLVSSLDEEDEKK